MTVNSLHIVLTGDSIFDNRSYTGGGPAVIDQVNDLLGASGRATLLARDGDQVQDLARQLRMLPDDSSNVIVSVGGNDALDYVNVLTEKTDSVAEAVLRLGEIVNGFEAQYREAIENLVDRHANVTVCTIYNGGFTDPLERQVVAATLRLFNDAIFQVANESGFSVIDLRRVCDQPEDYANPIEPSSTGGAKIARAILDVVSGV